VNRQNKTVRPDVPIPPDYQLSIAPLTIEVDSSNRGMA
jgi:hypothetical protein